jgi:multidrug efflux system membrane fusion protein
VLLTGCSKGGVGAPASHATPAQTKLKRNVELTQVRQERINSYVETVGYLDAEGQTEIAAGVAGLVEEVLFREGDWVIKDETLLVRIEPRRYQAMLAQADANLKKAEAAVKRAEANAAKGKAVQRDAEQTLKLRMVLQENLRKAGRSATTEAKQEAQVNVEVASARVDLAKADLEVIEAEAEAARKDVEAARALCDLAALNLQRSQVRAPYTGQINQRRITRGTYLEEKTVIATMADTSRLRLVGYIPEKAAPVVRRMVNDENRNRTGYLVGSFFASPWSGLGAVANDLAGETPAKFQLEFELRPFPRKTFYGRIFYLCTVANPDTHMFECKAEVPQHGRPGDLRPGYTAKIRVPLPGTPSSVVIPEEAVRASERGFIAFRPRPVKDKDGQTEYVAQAVTLDLGVRRPGWVEVLKGLHAGDWIVRKGAESLEDGTPLAVPDGQLPLISSGRR